MKIGLICTNYFNIDQNNKTGSGIFNYILINSLAKFQDNLFDFKVFASGQSDIPFPIESIDFLPSSADPKIVKNGKHIMFELALISKAFSQQSKFDLFHINIGDGDFILPFAPFVNKPILITLHNIINEDFTRKYFSIFKDQKNVHFVSVSNYQRKLLPDLNYIANIYHGIETQDFSFDELGGEEIMWAGRFIPGKGPDLVIKLAEKLQKSVKLFGVIKESYEEWFEENIQKTSKDKDYIKINCNYPREKLIPEFQNSKVFILPVLLEEAFGLVFAESMSCGTPVVTFARGAAPEIIEDGKTGFLVNPSDEDIRGDWIIKKTGIKGLCEA
nr:glycosyltransferase [Candidatus Gracilibacteria bacterium]